MAAEARKPLDDLFNYLGRQSLGSSSSDDEFSEDESDEPEVIRCRGVFSSKLTTDHISHIFFTWLVYEIFACLGVSALCFSLR